MGQYYKPVVIYGDGKRITANPHIFDNGLKLMEHSWVGNTFVNTVSRVIADKPARVAWVGDYSDGDAQQLCGAGGGFITQPEDFMGIYNGVWYDGDDPKGDCVPEIEADTVPFLFDLTHTDCYLANKTKGCYIDLEKYVRDNSFERYNNTWCVHPLPLLTCIGNGKGGGDYFSKPGADDVGTWAFDEVYMTALKPIKLEEVEFVFQE